MKNKKNILFIIISLIFPLLYKVLNKAYYYLIFNLNVINIFPKGVSQYLLRNYFSLDSIFCILMIIISLPVYFYMKKDDNNHIGNMKIVKMDKKGFIKAIIISLGIGGITVIWQIIARYVLTDVSSIANSVKSFDQTFKTGSTISMYVWSLISIGIVGPIVEEIVFRGITFSGINRYFNGIMTSIITGIYFGLWHVEPMQAVYTLILGIVLGLSYAATRNMWYPMIIHLVNNIISTPPPIFENNEFILLLIFGVRIISIIPMIIIMYKMVKKSNLIKLKTS